MSYTTSIRHSGCCGFTHSSRLCWPRPESRPGWLPWGRGRRRRCPRRRRPAAPAHRTRVKLPRHRCDSAKGQVALTLAMSQTVTSSQVAARSKLCTLFFTLRAILQSPQPKSATTREEGLEDKMGRSKARLMTGIVWPVIRDGYRKSASLLLNVRNDVIHGIGGPPLDLCCVAFVVDPEGLGILLEHALCLTARCAVQKFVDVAETGGLQTLLHAGPEGGRAILFRLLLLLC